MFLLQQILWTQTLAGQNCLKYKYKVKLLFQTILLNLDFVHVLL